MNIVVTSKDTLITGDGFIRPGRTLRVGSALTKDSDVPRLNVSGREHVLSLRAVELYNTGSALQLSVHQELSTAKVTVSRGEDAQGGLIVGDTVTFSPPINITVSIDFFDEEISPVLFSVLSDLKPPLPRYTDPVIHSDFSDDDLIRLVNAIAVANEQKTGEVILKSSVAKLFNPTVNKSASSNKTLDRAVRRLAERYDLAGSMLEQLIHEARLRGELNQEIQDKLKGGAP
ncbi:hypothetical protein [Paenarthrobacter ureafaciens]|uniref:hypothetical protein n=1 Tax=Paenarthrobacter ureafaciens TaxID=37931 RepID=UPI0021F0F298|nr:hypothetical protein [Paenarthrobacter ureafaciens]MEC3853940.1 hypothetical protein [Paenarthrobacter ureafaciens]